MNSLYQSNIKSKILKLMLKKKVELRWINVIKVFFEVLGLKGTRESLNKTEKELETEC